MTASAGVGVDASHPATKGTADAVRVGVGEDGIDGHEILGA